MYLVFSDYQLELYPSGEYQEDIIKMESTLQTRGSKTYKYKWGCYEKIKFPVRHLSPTQASIVNSWYESNADLNFYPHSITNFQVMSDSLVADPTDLSAWSLSGTPIVTSNTDIAPDGTLTADTVEDNSAAGSYVFNEMPSFTTATDYYVTIYIKKDAIPRATRFIKFQIECLGGTDTYSGCYLDTATGEGHKFAAVTDITDLSVTRAGDYWLYTFKFNDSNANNTFNIRLFPAAGADNNWAESGAAVGSAVFWGVFISETGYYDPNAELSKQVRLSNRFTPLDKYEMPDSLDLRKGIIELETF